MKTKLTYSLNKTVKNDGGKSEVGTKSAHDSKQECMECYYSWQWVLVRRENTIKVIKNCVMSLRSKSKVRIYMSHPNFSFFFITGILRDSKYKGSWRCIKEKWMGEKSGCVILLLKAGCIAILGN